MKSIKWLCLGIAGCTVFANSYVVHGDEAGPDYLKDSDSHSPLEAGFEESPFFEDQRWKLHLRTYYLERNTDREPDKQALATGGWLGWQSGFWRDFLQFGATAYTSQKIVGDKDKDDTGLLQDSQQSYGGISNLYIKLKLGDSTALRLGRFELNSPYINKSDSRMIPNSFQGGEFIHKFNPNWDLGAAYITHIKDRTSTDFEKAYDRAGIDGDEDIRTLTVRYHDNAGHNGGLYGYQAPDVLDLIYAEYNHYLELGKDSILTLAGQYTHRSSSGDELSGDFSGDHYGTKLVWETPLVTTTLAYTLYDGDRITTSWGSIPGYTSVMINDFNRTGEKAYLIGFDKDLSVWNLPGWRVGTNFTTGNTDDSGAEASPDQTEWNVNVKYTFQTDLLKGLSVFIRHARVDQKNTNVAQDGKDANGIRIITNYTIRF